MSKRISRGRLAKSVGLLACGAGVFGDSEVEGGIISVTASPSTIPWSADPFSGPGPTSVTLSPLGATFVQANDSFGKHLFGIGSFELANVSQGQRIDAALPFFSFIPINSAASGDFLFAFRVNNHYGWIKENLGGTGGAITFISGAYNDGTDLANDYIDAGTLNGGSGGGFAAVPEPGSVGLMGLATLAVGATALRRRRAAAAAAETVSAG
ncbi:MAG: hypothetical protein RIT02_2626 [Planctomycetota bacterium]